MWGGMGKASSFFRKCWLAFDGDGICSQRERRHLRYIYLDRNPLSSHAKWTWLTSIRDQELSDANLQINNRFGKEEGDKSRRNKKASAHLRYLGEYCCSLSPTDNAKESSLESLLSLSHLTFWKWNRVKNKTRIKRKALFNSLHLLVCRVGKFVVDK